MLASPNTSDSWGLVWGRQAWLCPSPCHDPGLPRGGEGGARRGEFVPSGLSAGRKTCPYISCWLSWT